MRMKTIPELLASGWYYGNSETLYHADYPRRITLSMQARCGKTVSTSSVAEVRVRLGKRTHFTLGKWDDLEEYTLSMFTDDPPVHKYGRKLPDWF